MKRLKYIIFLSILSGTFFVIYRHSDERGFRRRWYGSLQTAVLIALHVAGLIPVNTETIGPPEKNTQIYQERVLSDPEFNSYNNEEVILVKSDSNPILCANSNFNDGGSESDDFDSDSTYEEKEEEDQ